MVLYCYSYSKHSMYRQAYSKDLLRETNDDSVQHHCGSHSWHYLIAISLSIGGLDREREGGRERGREGGREGGKVHQVRRRDGGSLHRLTTSCRVRMAFSRGGRRNS